VLNEKSRSPETGNRLIVNRFGNESPIRYKSSSTWTRTKNLAVNRRIPERSSCGENPNDFRTLSRPARISRLLIFSPRLSSFDEISGRSVVATFVHSIFARSPVGSSFAWSFRGTSRLSSRADASGFRGLATGGKRFRHFCQYLFVAASCLFSRFDFVRLRDRPEQRVTLAGEHDGSHRV